MTQETHSSYFWSDGSTYETYMGRWSRQVAQAFLPWLAVPPGSRWLDVGCGTGALSQAILQRAAPAEVTGIDRSAGYIAYARRQARDPRARFQVGDALDLPAGDRPYGAAVSGLVFNFLSDPLKAILEIRRVLHPGGLAALYVWDYAGKMQFLRHFWNAAAALDPAAYGLDEGRLFPLCDPDRLAELFTSAGFTEVATRPIDVLTEFKDFDDFWTPFLIGQAPAPGYVHALPEDRRLALRERLRLSLPSALDGSIPLWARAWAVRGVAPGL